MWHSVIKGDEFLPDSPVQTRSFKSRSSPVQRKKKEPESVNVSKTSFIYRTFPLTVHGCVSDTSSIVGVPCECPRGKRISDLHATLVERENPREQDALKEEKERRSGPEGAGRSGGDGGLLAYPLIHLCEIPTLSRTLLHYMLSC